MHCCKLFAYLIHQNTLFRMNNRYFCPLSTSQGVARYPCGLRAGLRGWIQIAAATLSGNSLRQTVYTHRPSVHQEAKLVAVLLRVTASTAESNGSLTVGFMTHVTCRLTAKNRDSLRNPTLGSRVWATFLLFLPTSHPSRPTKPSGSAPTHPRPDWRHRLSVTDCSS